ncbi:hypothetical protein LINPERPRIM_LOCUS28361 [Linum perenne]
MASSAGIRCGGAMELKNHHHHRLFPNQAAATLPMRCNSHRRLPRLGVSAASASASNLVPRAVVAKTTAERSIAAENMDEWLRDSVTEIVNNLSEAPLLVQVYADEERGEKKLDTEKAVEEGDWKRLIDKWKKRESPLPEGVIFVEQLHDGGESEAAEPEPENDAVEEATKAWGIVVQGKGGDRAPVCYLLKTSRVGSGMGLCCTHFCLMRVNGFRESAKSQLKNCWLLQAQYAADRVC